MVRLCRVRQKPDGRCRFDKSGTVVLSLSVAESNQLEELVANALCGYTDKATEDVLLGLEIKFAVVNGETAMEGMSL